MTTTQSTPHPDINQKQDDSIEPIAQVTERKEPQTPDYDELKTIKSEQDPEIDIVNPDVKHSPDYTRDFLIDRRCSITNCIEMSLSFKNENDSNFNKQQETDEQTLYTFKIRAKHDDYRSFKYLNAVIKGNSSSSKCSSIGNNTVAVLGFTLSENPIISTQRGPIIIQDHNVLIGKKDGFKIFRNQKLIQKSTSPNTNFSQYGLSTLNFSLNPRGQIFFKKPNGICMHYHDTQSFSQSKTENCNFIFEKDLNHNATFNQSNKEQVFKAANNDGNYTITLYQNQCR